MSRAFLPKVVTANLLIEGTSVWLTEADVWSPRMCDAEFIEDEAHAEIRLLFAKSQPQTVVGPYLADARLGVQGPEPVHFREAFRGRGPSNYVHGAQVEA